MVGLGNPGKKYAFNRHNIGFLALDLFAEGLGAKDWGQDHKALIARTRLVHQNQDIDLILAKPQTFMNLSGQSVQSLLSYYKISLDDLLVVQDDIDQPFGQLRFHRNRGHGGHNGIRNISELLGQSDYARLKLGVGRPPHPQMEVADYVLQNFSSEEQDKLSEFLNLAGDAMESFMFEGLAAATNRFNGKSVEVK